MTVEEVRQRKEAVRHLILDAVREFTTDTGCLVEVRVTYPRFNTRQMKSDEPQYTYVGRYEAEVEVLV